MNHFHVTYVTLDDGPRPKNARLTTTLHVHVTNPEPTGLLRVLQRNLTVGVFRTMNYTDGKGRSTDHITGLRCFFADWDAGIPTSFRLPPTTIIQSSPGKGYGIWELTNPVEATADNRRLWQGIETALVRATDADPNAQDIARILRVPGFMNCKYPDRPPVRTLVTGGPTYTMDDVRNSYGYIQTRATADGAPDTQRPVGGTAERDAFRAFLSRTDLPSPGAGMRNAWLFKQAAWGIGTLRLPFDTVFDTMETALAERAWEVPVAELHTVIRNAERYARRQQPLPFEVEL